jgi:hypothetical protein
MEEKDLSIIINCECLFYHEWMTFASWYSIYKNISDAQILINLKRTNNLFKWIDKFNIEYYKNKEQIKGNIIKIISPSVMAVRNFGDHIDISSTKSDINSTFVDYKFGCGKFLLEEWTKKEKVPFKNASGIFSTNDLTVNEYLVLDLWSRCWNLYSTMGGLS